MKAAILTLILTLSTFAADDSLTTLNMRNGRFWAQLSEMGDYRPAFLMGMMEGWELRARTETDVSDSTAKAMDRSSQSSTEDLAKMVSSVYAEKQNLALPIGWVAVGCLAVQRGEVTKGAALTALRKHLVSVSEKLATASGKEDGISTAELDPVRVIAQLVKK